MAGEIPAKKLILCGGDDDGDDDKYYEDTRSECSLSLDRLTLEPRRKKLLVFDLNGLLVYRVYRSNKPEFPSDRTPDGRFGNHLVFKRPFAEEFVQFCLERFEIGIWSSALEKNVDAVLDCMMANQRNRLLFVWGQSQCTDSGFKSLEKRMKPLFFKELKKVWYHFGGKYSECDTLLIDDQPYKALLNPAHTGIFLESYNPDNASDNLLDPNGQLGVYLDGLAAATNAQVYVKENPIGVAAISSDHPDWNFYSEVLRGIKGESEEKITPQQQES
ncbi:uncharacterized protein LOC133709191 [Rosa rugosa]|uniref:uncharacterized protein LOC133709191 n=1 Tax=Rosa rugosa TaxID=74645 RepID=UPI002B402D4D|nr:uncharacterized protein LOC133709191 [Rosa rugosa]